MSFVRRSKYQLALLLVGAILIIIPLLLRRRAPSFIRDFFTTPTEAVNLALFRIILLLLVICFYFTLDVPWYSRMPPELLFPPTGLRWVATHLPMSEALTRTASILFLICCFAGMIGLFTRPALISGLILGIYVLGIPQLYGKINHYHHLLWMMAILSVSPCADMLSCDALIAARKRADRGLRTPPQPSLAYSLPLRFVWLLIGAIYFSSGLWKVWTGGYRWAFSDNLRNIMYNEWMGYGDWTPIFRLDQYPFLYQLAALASIIFELSFIALIFFPLWRRLAVAGGVVFHNMIYLLMRINFFALYLCYASFINWHELLRAAGRRLFRDELIIVYDGDCKLCRRTIASLRTLDVLGRINYVTLLEVESSDAPAGRQVGMDAPARDVRAFKGGKTWAGFRAYRAAASRIPLLWPVLPFLYLWPVAVIVRKFGGHGGSHHHCEIGGRGPGIPIVSAATSSRLRVRAVVVVGSLVLYAYSLSAVVKFNSWPMALYPTFEDLDNPEIPVITMSVELPSGQVIEVSPIREDSQMAPDRLMGLLNAILNVEDAKERRQRLVAFWQLWARDRPELRQAVSVRFYKDILSSMPADRNHPPVSRELVADLLEPAD